MTAYEEGLWANHDHAANSWRGSAADISNKIANKRRTGKGLTFVQLDIKNPDWCSPKILNGSTVPSRVARQILQPAGVMVMSKYIVDANSKKYPFVRDGLNRNEAIDLDGDPKKALQLFESGGPADRSIRVSSYSDTALSHGFGNCEEDQSTLAPSYAKLSRLGSLVRCLAGLRPSARETLSVRNLILLALLALYMVLAMRTTRIRRKLVLLLRISLTGLGVIRTVASSLSTTTAVVTAKVPADSALEFGSGCIIAKSLATSIFQKFADISLYLRYGMYFY